MLLVLFLLLLLGCVVGVVANAVVGCVGGIIFGVISGGVVVGTDAIVGGATVVNIYFSGGVVGAGGGAHFFPPLSGEQKQF